MKIKMLEESRETFGSLHTGDMFRVAINGRPLKSIYMKTEISYNKNDDELNAVVADTGEMCQMPENQTVFAVGGVFVEGYKG